MPQRYVVDVDTYKRIGGTVDLEAFVKGFVPDGAVQTDMTRFYAFSLIFEQLLKENVPGDLLELGTYQGRTAALLATMARRMRRTLYVLDTFEGFDERDLAGPDSSARVGTFSDTSLEAVRARVGEESVRYVKGYFPETANQLPPDGRYALVHIDCDLYAPILSALEYFYPRLTPGGFIIVHDYSSPSWAGAERAVDEFFAGKPESVLPLPDGAGSAIVRRMRAPTPGNNWLIRRRASLLTRGWALAGNSGLREILGEGWRSAEPWGVWGLGACHELFIAVPASMAPEAVLEADVNAFLGGSQTQQQVEIRLGDAPIGTWTFDTASNRGVRSVRLPLPAGEAPRGGLISLTLTLHPAELGIPAELNPALTERRPLGVGLHRLQLKPGS
jgi:hypothetical protein